MTGIISTRDKFEAHQAAHGRARLGGHGGDRLARMPQLSQFRHDGIRRAGANGSPQAPGGGESRVSPASIVTRASRTMPAGYEEGAQEGEKKPEAVAQHGVRHAGTLDHTRPGVAAARSSDTIDAAGCRRLLRLPDRRCRISLCQRTRHSGSAARSSRRSASSSRASVARAISSGASGPRPTTVALGGRSSPTRGSTAARSRCPSLTRWCCAAHLLAEYYVYIDIAPLYAPLR